MPAQSQLRLPTPPPQQTVGPALRSGAGVSNSAMQDRLREVPLQKDPSPWAAQQRSVRFNPVAGGALFQDGANENDVVQGQNGSRYLGDCWLLSSLAAIAHTQPQVLEKAVTDNKDGSYTVRLYRQERNGGMKAEDVRVQGTLPQTGDGKDAYAQRQNPGEIWVGIIEKAFAAWKGGYGNLDGGIPSDALTALTGKPTRTAFTQGAGSESLGGSLQQASAAGSPMVAASRGDLSLSQGGIVPGHGHTILGVREEGGKTLVTLRDPYAKYEPGGNGPRDGVFTVTLEEFQKRFQYATWVEPDAKEPEADQASVKGLPGLFGGPPQAADTNTSLSLSHLQPLPGGLDDTEMIVSNNPEKFTKPGYLFRSSGKTGAVQHGEGGGPAKERGDLGHTFNKGGFVVYLHHLNDVAGVPSVNMVVILRNPSGKPVKGSLNGAIQQTRDPKGGWGMGKEGFGGPNAVAAEGVMNQDPGRGFQQNRFTIPPGGSIRAVVHPVARMAEVDGRFEVDADGPLTCDVLAEAAGADNGHPSAANGHWASTAPGAFGRASGIYQGANWTYRGGPMDIPEKGQARGYLVCGTKNQQKLQMQPPQAIHRYADSSAGVEGGYGVRYDLKFPLHNPTGQSRKVQVAFTAPMKEGERQPPSFHWMGPVKVNGQLLRVRVNELGDGAVLGTWEVPAGGTQDVHLEFLTPGDITAPEAIELRTL